MSFAGKNIKLGAYETVEAAFTRYKEYKEDFAKRTGNVAHPLIEKMFNVYAPKYAKRKAELGQGGGYTRVLQLGARRGDNAQMAIVELI